MLNRPDETARVYKHALSIQAPKNEPSSREPLWVARRMREALVKSAAIGGLPRVG